MSVNSVHSFCIICFLYASCILNDAVTIKKGSMYETKTTALLKNLC